MGFERDYFLALPTSDRGGLRPIEAKYRDATEMTRALLMELPRMRSAGADTLEMGDGKLVPIYLAKFWTEHSPRAGLPSWAAALGMGKDIIDRLGRWRAVAGAEYVGTARTIVHSAHALPSGSE